MLTNSRYSSNGQLTSTAACPTDKSVSLSDDGKGIRCSSLVPGTHYLIRAGFGLRSTFLGSEGAADPPLQTFEKGCVPEGPACAAMFPQVSELLFRHSAVEQGISIGDHRHQGRDFLPSDHRAPANIDPPRSRPPGRTFAGGWHIRRSLSRSRIPKKRGPRILHQRIDFVNRIIIFPELTLSTTSQILSAHGETNSWETGTGSDCCGLI